MSDQPVNNQTNTHHVKLDFIDWMLLSTVFLVLIIISSFLINNMNSQNKTYDGIISHLMSVSTIRKLDPHTVDHKIVTDTIAIVDHSVNAAILSFARAKDFANIKLGSALLGFLLIFIGALYLLKVFNLSYKASLSQPSVGNVSIQTTSPGLVMITLGVAVMMTALITRNEVNYSVPVSDVALAENGTPADNTQTVGKHRPNLQSNGYDLKATDNKIADLERKNDSLTKMKSNGLISGVSTSTSESEIVVPVKLNNQATYYVIPGQNKGKQVKN